eukprot:11032119-Alexandrium_andersonii.AAC.1
MLHVLTSGVAERRGDCDSNHSRSAFGSHIDTTGISVWLHELKRPQAHAHERIYATARTGANTIMDARVMARMCAPHNWFKMHRTRCMISAAGDVPSLRMLREQRRRTHPSNA